MTLERMSTITTSSLWEMGFPTIRHFAASRRRAHMDRAINRLECEGENDCRTAEVSERELVLVVSVRCGKERDVTRG